MNDATAERLKVAHWALTCLVESEDFRHGSSLPRLDRVLHVKADLELLLRNFPNV